MADNFTRVGNEVQVNLVPNQNASQTDPDIATLTDGRFFVAFDDFDGNVNIIAQFVNPDGTLAGSNIDIDVSAGNQFDAAVALRAAGGAVVVWNDGPASDEIHYVIVSSAGSLGTEQTILDGNDLRRPDVATLADGRSLVVANQDNAGLDVVFRFIDAAGAPSVALQDFIDNGPGDQFEPAVAAFGNNALVVYADNIAGTDNVQARFYNGTSFAAEVTIADPSEDIFDVDVAALTDGRFIVVWEDGATTDIHARFVSATGVPLGDVFSITFGGGYDYFARVAALPDGGFIATWTNNGTSVGSEVDSDSDAVLARRFDATGAPVGDLFLVNTGDPDTHQNNSAVGANAAGQAFIAWEDDQTLVGDTQPDGIRGHAFLATTDTVNGTEGDDIIQTYSLGEPINGLGGDDLINGLAGDDVIHGGAGLDQLKGGLGNDQLFGEGGEDLLKGEDGNDLLVGGLGRDVQIGGTGQDTFDFNASKESRVGANHDLIKGFSHAQHDKINLQTIDADATAGGNQAFDFIGGAGFTGTAGELRLSAGLLLGDTNGNGIADFEIKVTGIGAGATSDFVL